MAKDLLFATLDTTQRTIRLPQGRPAILSDTVGFISDLPHELVESFRATLEEVGEADLILHVRDIACDRHRRPGQGRRDGAETDRDAPRARRAASWRSGTRPTCWTEDVREAMLGQAERLAGEGTAVAVSAWTGEGIEALRHAITDLIDDDPGDGPDAGPVTGRGAGLALRAWPGHVARHR